MASFHERGRRDGSNSWRVLWRDRTSRQAQRTFHRFKAAQEFWHEAEAEERRGVQGTANDEELHALITAAADACDAIQLEGHLRGAAVRAGAHARGLDDAILRGSVVFEVDGSGKVVAKGGGALTPEQWAPALRPTAPHVFSR